eukprot:1190253-Prorocentrum_minimum.AAC.2
MNLRRLGREFEHLGREFEHLGREFEHLGREFEAPGPSKSAWYKAAPYIRTRRLRWSNVLKITRR